MLRPLIFVKGFFYAELFSLREHLQTRGHRRVFELTSINVAAPSGETTVLGLSATFEWHKKLNSCPSLAHTHTKRAWMFWCSLQGCTWGAGRDDELISVQNLPHADTAGRPRQWSIQHVCFASTRMCSDSCTYAFFVP